MGTRKNKWRKQITCSFWHFLSEWDGMGKRGAMRGKWANWRENDFRESLNVLFWKGRLSGISPADRLHLTLHKLLIWFPAAFSHFTLPVFPNPLHWLPGNWKEIELHLHSCHVTRSNQRRQEFYVRQVRKRANHWSAAQMPFFLGLLLSRNGWKQEGEVMFWFLKLRYRRLHKWNFAIKWF